VENIPNPPTFGKYEYAIRSISKSMDLLYFYLYFLTTDFAILHPVTTRKIFPMAMLFVSYHLVRWVTGSFLNNNNNNNNNNNCCIT
jgi:hypothetical protein